MQKLSVENLKINESYVKERIVDFIIEKINESKLKGFVIGLSGGIDSSTTLKLLYEAISYRKIYVLILPDTTSTPKEDIISAKELAESLNIKYNLIYIDQLIQSYSKVVPIYDKSDKVANGNLKARIRMTILYYYANKLNYMVAGTGDKSEIILGYFTKYGDGGSDVLPIGDLYKTQVRMLARYLKLPFEIVNKPSSPNLWPGQTAEGELGLSYESIDLFLYAVFDLRMSIDDAIKVTSLTQEDARRIMSMISKNEHKRMLAPIPRVSSRTIGLDWRFPFSYSIH